MYNSVYLKYSRKSPFIQDFKNAFVTEQTYNILWNKKKWPVLRVVSISPWMPFSNYIYTINRKVIKIVAVRLISLSIPCTHRQLHVMNRPIMWPLPRRHDLFIELWLFIVSAPLKKPLWESFKCQRQSGGKVQVKLWFNVQGHMPQAVPQDVYTALCRKRTS